MENCAAAFFRDVNLFCNFHQIRNQLEGVNTAFTVKPRCNEVLGITNYFLYPCNSKTYGKSDIDITSFASLLALRYIELPLCKGNNLKLCISLNNF